MPGIFSIDQLEVLSKINNTFRQTGGGIEFSSYAAVASPSSTSPVNDNYTSGYIVNSRYAGSVLFDTLYGTTGHDGVLHGYTWKTGYYDLQSSTTIGNATSKCRLLFGIIPVFWSNGENENITNGVPSFYGPGSLYSNTTKLVSFVNYFFGASEVTTLNKIIHYYRVVDGDADCEDPSYVSDTVEHLDFELLTIHNAIGLGVNITNMHNYKSCDFSLKDYKIINSRHNNRYAWWGIEKSGIAGHSWLPDPCSIMPRIGAIPAKNINTRSIDYIPAFGYFRYDNKGAGESDTSLVTWSDNEYVYKVPWNTYIGSATNLTNDGIFGSPVFGMNGAGGGRDLNQILEEIALDNIGFFNSYLTSQRACYDRMCNMLEYDTLKFSFDAVPECPVTSFHCVPVFATSIHELESIEGASSVCCLISLFQSIIYNTYDKDVINTGGYGSQNNDINSINPNARANRTNTNQSNNSYSHYNNGKFVIKYDENAHELYISYALRITGDNNGNPTGLIAGHQHVEEHEWVAWINGNIYVIPDEIFTRFVYYTPSDFNKLNTLLFD